MLRCGMLCRGRSEAARQLCCIAASDTSLKASGSATQPARPWHLLHASHRQPHDTLASSAWEVPNRHLSSALEHGNVPSSMHLHLLVHLWHPQHRCGAIPPLTWHFRLRLQLYAPMWQWIMSFLQVLIQPAFVQDCQSCLSRSP